MVKTFQVGTWYQLKKEYINLFSASDGSSVVTTDDGAIYTSPYFIPLRDNPIVQCLRMNEEKGKVLLCGTDECIKLLTEELSIEDFWNDDKRFDYPPSLFDIYPYKPHSDNIREPNWKLFDGVMF